MQALQEKPPFEGYAEEEVPLGSYAMLMAVFSGLVLLAYKLARARSEDAPSRYSVGDLALLALATHKISRILTKDWVTSPLRAPFTRYEENLGAGEILERSRGGGLRAAVGDLLTCNYCIGPWVATGLVAGKASRPRLTRVVATVFALVAVSDFLHGAYQVLQSEGKRLEQSG